MGKNKRIQGAEYREVKTAGFKQSKRISGINRRAGLHGKNGIEGETRVKRCKPLALKHIRRMRKVALAFSAVFVVAVAAVGVGFFKRNDVGELADLGFETVCYATPTDGSLPTQHTLVENVGYMNYVLQNQPYWSSEMQSTVNTVLSQRVFTYKQYYEGVLISADIAQGVSSEATQFCVANGIIMWRSAANKNFDGMNTPWSTKDAQGMTIAQFKKMRGLPPSEFSVYVLNEKTIANAEDYTVAVNADGTYTMTLTLNVNTGVDETSADYYYKQQMLVTGGLDEHPVIDATTLIYTFDENWRVLGFEIADSYSAKMGISVHCTSNTYVTFSYEEESAKNTFYQDYFSAQYDKLKDTLTDGADDFEAEPAAPNPLNYLAAAFGNILTEGATFKLDIAADNLKLDGAVYIGLDGGALSDVRARLGDINIILDGNTLYFTDGKAKYKLDIGGLLPSGGGAEDALGSLDVNSLIEQLTDCTFTVGESSALFETSLGIFGLDIALTFEFDTTNGIELGYAAAQIPVGNKLLTARFEYGTESDIPAKPQDMSGYTDVLNDGVTVDLRVELDELILDGFAKIMMNGGAFGGVYATLGDFAVYYDCPANMLYITDGGVRYKLSLSGLGAQPVALGADSEGGLDFSTLLPQIVNNFSAADGKISTAATLEALGQTLNAALAVQLVGGIKIDASVGLGGTYALLSASLSNREVTLPDFSGYEDMLNSDVTLDVNITLDEVTLNGKLTVALRNGEVTDIRADFGEIKLYYELPAGALYLAVGETKIFVSIQNTDEGALDIGNLFGGLVSKNLSELLGNITAGLKQISVSADLNVLDSIVPVSATLGFDGGVSVKAEVMLFGISVGLNAALGGESVPALSEGEKQAYVDVMQNAWELADNLLGEHLTATVSGTLSENNAQKYNFSATLEYDKGHTYDEEGNAVVNGFPFHIDTGVKEEGQLRTGMDFHVDSTLYLHFNLALKAVEEGKDSLYLDLYLLDANPQTELGKTTGGYTTDGNLDIYLSLSKYAVGAVDANGASLYEPLMLYAPIDEILTFVSMAGALANLDKITFEDNEELTSAVAEISNIVEQLLIEKNIPHTKDQFAALGDSLIRQILGKSLGEFLGETLASLETETEKVSGREFKLSEEFVESFRYGNDSLELILNSKSVYNSEKMTESDNVRAQLTKCEIDGVSYLSAISVENIFFGDKLESKLDIGLDLDYGEITRPEAFIGYTNADGLDTLLKAIVNSASHATPDADAAYDINHYYLLQGNLKAGISILGIINKDAIINFNSIAVYIDEETNDVSIDAHISYNGVSEANQTAIDGKADVYISIKGGAIAIRRIKYSHYVTYAGLYTREEDYSTPLDELRVMTLKDFSANLMDNLTFIFNFGPVITDNLNGSSGGGNEVSFDGYDYGKSMNTVLSYYVSEENASGASWTVAVNGGLIEALSGLTTDDIRIKFSATLNEDGTYTVNALEILETTMKLWGNVVKLNVSGNITYCNPHEEMGGYTDSTQNLIVPVSYSVASEFDLGEGFILDEQQVSERGTVIKLPIYNKVVIDGQTYVLDGYTVGGNNGTGIKIEKDEDGTQYATLMLVSDAEITAVWSKLYTVKYLGLNDEVLHVVVYHENDGTLTAENTPAVPELYGYTGVWSGAEGTKLTSDCSFKLSYSPVQFTLTVTDGNQTVSFTRYYGETVEIGELNTNTYIAKYFYDADDNRFTSLPVDGDKTYNMYRVGKVFNVEYVSDLDYSGSLDTSMQYGDDSDYLGAITRDGATFLGWFVKEGESYKYVASVSALKDYVAQTDFENGLTVTLYAVWRCDVSVAVTTATRTYKGLWTEWRIGGTFTMAYASELSETVLNNSDVYIETSVKFAQGSESQTKDNLSDYVVFTGEEFIATYKCGALYDYGWATVKVSYKCGNSEISYSENSDCKKR